MKTTITLNPNHLLAAKTLTTKNDVNSKFNSVNVNVDIDNGKIRLMTTDRDRHNMLIINAGTTGETMRSFPIPVEMLANIKKPRPKMSAPVEITYEHIKAITEEEIDEHILTIKQATMSNSVNINDFVANNDIKVIDWKRVVPEKYNAGHNSTQQYSLEYLYKFDKIAKILKCSVAFYPNPNDSTASVLIFKDDIVQAISRPSYATLKPKIDESVDFDNTVQAIGLIMPIHTIDIGCVDARDILKLT